jgi:hypothetical protein
MRDFNRSFIGIVLILYSVIAAQAQQNVGADALTPANSLSFVPMTVCRLVDTRAGSPIPGSLGAPSLVAEQARTFPVRSSTTCPIPATAQAYSFNITVVPAGFLDFITVWPAGQTRPNASTLNDYLGTVIANAAVVPAGVSGSVEVFASHKTDLIIDINGYYIPQTTAGSVSADSKIDTLEYYIRGHRVLSTGTGSNQTLLAGEDAGGASTTGPQNSFFGWSAGKGNGAGSGNAYFGAGAGRDITGSNNAFFGQAASLQLTSGSRNAFFGSFAGSKLSTGSSGNTLLGAFSEADEALSNATAIGNQSLVTASNSLVLGSINGTNGATAGTNVGIGLTAPNSRLDVVDTAAQIRFGVSSTDAGGYLVSSQSSQATISGGAKWNGSAWVAKATAASLIDNNTGGINFFTNTGLTSGSTFSPTLRASINASGLFSLLALGAAGTTPLCRNASNNISMCSSSIRYKTNLKNFDSGIDLVRRLHPVSFNWKQDGLPDLGLVAEDVAALEPLLVTRNAQSEVEGVKYDRISVVLVNAVKEQQAQIESQRKQIDELREEIDALKRLIGVRP